MEPGMTVRPCAGFRVPGLVSGGRAAMPTAKKEHATDGSSLPTTAAGEPMTAMASAQEARMPMHGNQPSPSEAETGAPPTPDTMPAAPTSRRRRRVSAGPQRRESAALFRALSEHATDLVLILEADGTIRYASPSHQRLLGYTPAQMEGHNAAEFVHPADLPAVRARTVATARK